MKAEYDFANAEQGKFYRPLEELDIPVYLDSEVRAFFVHQMRKNNADFSLNAVVNAVLKKDIEISKELQR